MAHIRKLLAAVLVSAMTCAHGQSRPYSDADNPSQAVGMLKGTVVAAAALLAECSKRFPKLSVRMHSDLTTWRDHEARLIEKVEYFWERMKRKEPKLGDMEKFMGSAALKQLAILDDAPNLDSSLPSEVTRQYCSKYFEDLASGVWRKRTPKAYEYLDAAPAPPPSGTPNTSLERTRER